MKLLKELLGISLFAVSIFVFTSAAVVVFCVGCVVAMGIPFYEWQKKKANRKAAWRAMEKAKGAA